MDKSVKNLNNTLQIINALETQSRLYFRKSQVDKNKVVKITREQYFIDKMQDCDNIIKMIKNVVSRND